MANRRPVFHNATAAPPQMPPASARWWQAANDVGGIVACAAATIFISAWLYFIGCGYGWGIVPTFAPIDEEATVSRVSFVECLYFSIVTIATLGYGDYRPVSWARCVAAGEVAAGLVMAGVFVSQLVSRKPDRLVRRILKSIGNTEVQRFRDQLSALLDDLRSHPPALEAERPSGQIHRSKGLARAIARYYRDESMQPELREYVQRRSVSRLHGEVTELLSLHVEIVTQHEGRLLHRDDVAGLRVLSDSVTATSLVFVDSISAARYRPQHEEVLRLAALMAAHLRKRT